MGRKFLAPLYYSQRAVFASPPLDCVGQSATHRVLGLVRGQSLWQQCQWHPHHLPSLSILTAIFPIGPGIAGTRMSPFGILLELRMAEMVATTVAIRCAKLQSNHHHQQTNIQLFTGQMPFLSGKQQCQSTEGTTSSSII